MINSVTNPGRPDETRGICLMAVVPIRKAPDERSEMISQILFGETFDIDEVLEEWLKITTLFDQYSGWIDRKFYNHVAETGNPSQTVLGSRLAEIVLPNGAVQLISGGSTLPDFDPANNEFSIGKQKYRLNPLLGDGLVTSSQNMQETARRFLKTPYLWGGRSVFGFDCSGFIQTLFKMHGHSLQRDTDRQVESTKEVRTMKDTVPCDLAFFSSAEGRVDHVGMVLDGGEIIHCSGWVRIDRLDEKGIFNREKGVYTHRLSHLRRM